MRLTIAQELLDKAVRVAVQAVAKRTTLPITNCLLLEATDDGRLTVTGTDLEIRLSAAVSATVSRTGSLCVAGSTLAGIVGGLPAGVVTLDSDGKALSITNSSSRAKLAGQSADDFPRIGEPADVDELTADPKTLAESIRRSVFACATDRNRPVLTGQFWQCNGRNLTLAAADGFRLAVMPAEVGSEAVSSFILPSRAASIVEGLCDSAPVRIRWTASQVYVDAGDGVTLVSQLIDGTFPKYAELIPQNPKCIIDVDREQLLKAVDFVSHVGQHDGEHGKFWIVRFVLTPDGLRVSAGTADAGDAETLLPAVATACDNRVRFALDRTYCRDALRLLGGERVFLEWTEASGPVNFRTVECDGVVTVMPQFVQW